MRVGTSQWAADYSKSCDRCSLTYLLFASLALVVGCADIIEKAVQLANDGVDLLGKMTGVHGGKGGIAENWQE